MFARELHCAEGKKQKVSHFFCETLAEMEKSSYLCTRKRGKDTPVFRGYDLRSLRAGMNPLRKSFFERLANKTK